MIYLTLVGLAVDIIDLKLYIIRIIWQGMKKILELAQFFPSYLIQRQNALFARQIAQHKGWILHNK